MKRTMRFLSMAAFALLGAVMTGCSSNNDSIIDEQQPEDKSSLVTMSTTVSMDGATTRALTADGVKTFAAGDKIAVVYKNTSNKTAKAESVALTDSDITNDGKSATFTVTLDDPDRMQDVTYIYPAAMAKADGTVNYDALNEQDGTLATLASTLDLCTKSGVWDAGALPSLELENQLAILAITLKNSDGSSDITRTITGMSVSDGSNTYAVSRSAKAGPIYVAIQPVSEAAIEITATDGTTNYTKSLTGKTYAAGNGYNVSWRMEGPLNCTDLSMLDCAGNARASRWTANCYMVHTAGKYKLPLVYGNAIKDGKANTAAYTGVSGEYSTATFPNHADQAITAPWITKSASGTGVDKGMGIAVTSAELLWQDAQGLVTAVGIDGDYLTLTVGKDATAKEGNALIAAKLADGTIVWSWHIWVTKQTFATLTPINTGSYTYQLTPVNLGWVGDATSTTGYHTFYQWGRKDAFIPGTGTDNTNHIVYDINNNEVTGITSYTIDDINSISIGYNIQHPTVYCGDFDYEDEIFYGPCNTKYCNMWDAQNTNEGDIAVATVKTVYDPCPTGFCVPAAGLYFCNKIFGVFFPASGHRFTDSGDLSGVGRSGNYWSATPAGVDGVYFYFYPEQLGTDTGSRSRGYPVRAVAE